VRHKKTKLEGPDQVVVWSRPGIRLGVYFLLLATIREPLCMEGK
jgi:hypothetical protein